MPVGLVLSPDNRSLYVAEVGINAVGVIELDRRDGRLVGHIPVGWWPSSIKVSADGTMLYVANARGRGAGPNRVNESTSPKYSTLGSVSILPVPDASQRDKFSERVLANNGFSESEIAQNETTKREIPFPKTRPTQRKSACDLINKENATHDLLGDITTTRKCLSRAILLRPGADAAPNHHELALSFAFR
jgi:hypothetical protein